MYQGPKCIIFGWDAGCLEYLQPLAQNGKLSNLNKLFEEGVFGTLKSPLPALTPVSWSTIVTGTSPPSHGIYSWWGKDPSSYEPIAFNSSSIKSKHILTYLSEQGLKIGAVGIPMTAPPFPVNGFIFSGIGNPNSTADWGLRKVYPEGMIAKYEREHADIFNFDFSAMATATCNKQLFSIWKDYEEKKQDLIIDLVRKEKPDVLWVHCHAGDYFGHRVPHNSDILGDAFALIDQTIGKISAQASPSATTIVLSDHGQTEIDRFLLIQNILKDKGLLTFKQRIARERFGHTILKLADIIAMSLSTEQTIELIKKLGKIYYRLSQDLQARITELVENILPCVSVDHNNIDWLETTVYSFEPGGLLRINLKGREPNGIVDPNDYDSVVDNVIDIFENDIIDPDTNEKVNIKAYRYSQLYSSAILSDRNKVHGLPDIVLDVQDRSIYACNTYSLHLGEPSWVTRIDHQKLNQRYRFLDQEFHGDHTVNGFYAIKGESISFKGEKGVLNAVDFVPILLNCLGLNIPEFLEGTPSKLIR